MGKASRKKRRQELQAESILNGKSLISSEISSKWSLFNKPIVHFFLIAIVGFLIYSNTFHVPFHFDDTNNIVENNNLKDLNNFCPPSGSRWFGFLTFALNYKLGGLDTTGFHIVNLIIHIINAILIYFLVVLTFKTPYFKVSVISASVSNQPNQFNLSTFKPLNYLPLFIALIFVSHPIQTQAVTYIVQRFTSLATMFYLLSLVMYIKARLEVKAKVKFFSASTLTFYLISLLSAILAMKTKEIAFTLPFIVVLYEFCFFKSQNYELRTMNLRRLLYLIPFLLTLFIIPLSLIGIDKPVGDVIGELREAVQETEEIPKGVYLLTQFRVIVTYIRLLFLPLYQNLDYDYSLSYSFFETKTFLSFIFLLSIFVLAIYLFRWSRRTDNGYSLLISFGILWFFIALSVESSIIPIRDVINEHRLYLPSVGISMVFSSAIFYVLRFNIWMSRISSTICYLLTAIIVTTLSIVTFQRNNVWQDKMSLWGDVVKKSPNKARGHHGLGVAYYEKNLFDEAITQYQLAISLKPDYAEAHSNLGVLYKAKGWINKAGEQYQIALRLKPDYADAHNNLGVIYMTQGLVDKAIEQYQIALRLKPKYIDAYYNLGIAYETKWLTDKAIEYYQVALSLKPDYIAVHKKIANLFYFTGRMDKAIEHYQILLKLDPENADIYSNLGSAYYSNNMFDKAIEYYQIAIKLKSNFVEVHNNLGSAYGAKGLTDKAIEQFQIAVKLKPEYVDAHNNLGNAYMAKGWRDNAVKHFNIARSLKPKQK